MPSHSLTSLLIVFRHFCDSLSDPDPLTRNYNCPHIISLEMSIFGYFNLKYRQSISCVYLDRTVFGLAGSPNTWLLLFVEADERRETGVLLHSNTVSFSQSFSICCNFTEKRIRIRWRMFHTFYFKRAIDACE